MSQQPPKLFIFDMGGVVSRNTDVLLAVAAQLRLTPERLRELAGDLLARLITGGISSGEFWRVFSQRSGLEVREDLLARYFKPHADPEVVELARSLRAKARVVVGTNTVEAHYRIHRERGDYEPFDAVYASHRMGLAKPDPAFYEHILRQERAAAREAVFVDDMPENVQAAAALGIRAFHFRGAAELKRHIGELLRSGA
jgi:HAD superfamily hydrolase (TIGR01509 family)